MKKIIIFLVALAILGGCSGVPKKQYTRAEWLDITSRTYEGTSAGDVFSDIETIFKMADEEDVTFVHTENSIIVDRKISMYLVIAYVSGFYRWHISVHEKEGRVIVSSHVESFLNGSSGAMVGNTYIPSSSGGSGGASVTNVDSYKLFWSRLDFLQGKSAKWYTCEGYMKHKNVDKKGYEYSSWDGPEDLCLNVSDNVPE